MKTISLLNLATLMAMLSWGPASLPAQARLKVVATTPDLASLAREIGGEAVEVTALAKPTEDPHFVDAKPSLIVTLNRADVLIQGGAELEVGWLPPLLESARNSKLASGAPGLVLASDGIKLLEVPASLDRSKGDVHAMGNPHFMIDPVNVRLVAERIAEHLAKVQPASAPIFQANLKKFQAALDARLVAWNTAMGPFKGAKIVTYHRDFVYLAQRFGLEVVATLEPKPGIAPSPAHLAQVIATMKATKARAILVQPFQNRKTAENVAGKVGGVVLDTPQQPGAVPKTENYFALMDYIVSSLVAALRSGT